MSGQVVVCGGESRGLSEVCSKWLHMLLGAQVVGMVQQAQVLVEFGGER